jgi:DNA-binding transcriptional LysR family regulator
MTRRPDLEDLDMLLRVARAGSIGQAAAELRLTQPSVSRRMANLERSLGVQLLQRSRRGTTLTQSGRVVVDWADTLLSAADDFSRSTETLREQAAAALRAAVSMTIAEHLAPGWLARLPVQVNKEAISLVVSNSTEVADLVESGRVDIGFVESPTVRSSLNRRRFAWDRLVVAVPPDHEWAARSQPVTAAMLAATPLLVREPGSGTRETIEAALARAGFVLPVGLALASNAALKSSALAGMGPVVLSELALDPETATGSLVGLQVSDLDLRRPLSVVWRPGAGLSPPAAALLAVATSSRD